MRISQSNVHLPSVHRGTQITVHINGRQISAFTGETIAAVLLVEGNRISRHTRKTGQPRGIFCGMGICYDCLVTVDGDPNIRACITPVTNGMVIETRSEMEL